MFRPLETVPLPSNTITNLYNNGYYFVEDVEAEKPEIVEKYINLNVLKELLKTPITLSALDHWQAELQYEKVKTTSKSLNQLLDDGFQCGTITELNGASGSGKTQICFQISVTVQLPTNYGGLSGKAFYIDTRNAFSYERINDIINGYKKLYPNLKLNYHNLLENIIVTSPASVEELSSLIENLHTYVEKFTDIPIRLIVIDSLSFVICSIDDGSARIIHYVQILHNLQKLASKYNFAVVIVNELTTHCNDKGEVEFVSAGGENVANRCQKRLMLTRISGAKFAARILKSSVLPQMTVPFYIIADGIVDVQDNKNQ